MVAWMWGCIAALAQDAAPDPATELEQRLEAELKVPVTPEQIERLLEGKELLIGPGEGLQEMTGGEPEEPFPPWGELDPRTLELWEEPYRGGGMKIVPTISGGEGEPELVVTDVPTLQFQVVPTEEPDNVRFAREATVAVGPAAHYHCTGVWVAPSVVLTARHCLPATRVLVGPRVSAASAELRVLKTAVADVDAALLWVDPLPWLRPVSWRTAADLTAPFGDGLLVGFGATDNAGRVGFGERRFGAVNLQGWGCDQLRARALGCRPAWEMVLPRGEVVDTCDGDSGGPLFELTGEGPRLIAITSRAVANSTVRCGGGGVYTRVDRLASWMEQVIAAWAAGRVP